MKREGFLVGFRLIGLGWHVAFSIIGGIAGGIWIDKQLGTLPLFMVLGILLGSVIAFYGVYKLVKPLLNTNEKASVSEEDIVSGE